MIYKSYTLNCYFHKIEKRYISFCSFLASISPGASANFSCSPRKSSGVVLSFKTLTSFFRPSISLLRILRSASDSVSLCSSFFILSDSYYTRSSFHFIEVLRKFFYWAKGAAFVKRSKFCRFCPDSDCSSCFCLPCIEGQILM